MRIVFIAVLISASGITAGDLLKESITDNTGTPFDISGNPAQAFSAYSYMFTANSVLSILAFDDTTVDADFGDGGLDNVRVTAVAVVPEASSVTLLLSALGMVGVIAARRKNSSLMVST